MDPINAPDPNSLPVSTSDPSQPGGPLAAQPNALAATQQQPSLWKSVLQGALTGLAGSAGAKHFGGGVGAGAERVLQQQQLQVENQRAAAAQAADIQFKNVQAANSVAEAARNNAVAASLPQQAKDAHDKAQLEMAQQMQSLGITPVVIADDTHEGATAGLKALTQSQGAVPHLFNLEVGGQHLAYDLSQLSGTPQGLKVINDSRRIQGLPEITPIQWKQTPKAAQDQTAESALKFFAPPPSKNAQEAQSMYLQYKGWADAYGKRPDADPETVNKLNTLTGNLKTIRDGLQTQARSDKAAEAFASAEAQKQARIAVDREEYQNNLASGDVTGWTPPKGRVMSEQQFNAANQKFISGTYSKAQDTEKGYQMFLNAYADRGNAKTGAQGMLALSQHLANTFGGVKGSRITKDLIKEHLGARGISDDALVATQKLSNGDPLSENQWQAFRGLITDARDQTWKNTIQQGHALGVPVTADMIPKDVVSAKSGSSTTPSNKHSDIGFVPN